MSVERSDVDGIARLARLRLGSAEAEALTLDMNRILEHVDRLQVEVSSRSDSGVAVTPGQASPSAVPIEDDLLGVRLEGADEPDALGAQIADFAPEVKEAFFVVPPPPGVGVEPLLERGARG